MSTKLTQGVVNKIAEEHRAGAQVYDADVSGLRIVVGRRRRSPSAGTPTRSGRRALRERRGARARLAFRAGVRQSPALEAEHRLNSARPSLVHPRVWVHSGHRARQSKFLGPTKVKARKLAHL